MKIVTRASVKAADVPSQGGQRVKSFAMRSLSLLTASVLAASVLIGGTPALADTAPDNPANPATPATVSADGLPTVQVDGVVWQQTVVGNTVYAVGSFSNARPAGAAPGTNLTPRRNILAYDIRTGNLITTFNASLNAQAVSVAASPDGSRIYVGGSFTQVNGATRHYLAALDPNTGAAITSFTPWVNSRVTAIVATNTTVYLGGWFSGVGSVARTKLAAVNSANAALLPWNPQPAGGDVMALTLAPDASKVVIGGSFTSMNGSNNPGYGLAAVDTGQGALLPWAANSLIRNGGANAAILSLTSDSTHVYGTGYVFGSGGNLEGTFSAGWNDGAIKWVEDCHGDTYDVYAADEAVYTVGHAHYCGNIGGFPQTEPQWTFYPAIGFSKAATGTITRDPLNYFNFAGRPAPSLLNWFPELSVGGFTGQSQAAWAVSGNAQYVVLGGEFPRVNGVSQQGLVRFGIKSVAPNKVGPAVTGSFFNPTVFSPAAGTVRVNWQANWDKDNTNLTYRVIRDGNTGSPIAVVSRNSTFWDRPAMGFTDTGLQPGSTHGYRIFATDPLGNIARSDSVSVTVASTGAMSAYASEVWGHGALNYWRLGESGGSTAADSAGWLPQSTGSGVTWGGSGAIQGDTNTAASFNGTSSGLGATAKTVSGPNTFTVEGWFKTTTRLGGKILGFGNRNATDSTRYDRHIYMDNLGRIFFGVNSSGIKTVNSPLVYNDGNWHHVTATLSPGGMVLYLDGQRVGQRTDATYGQAYFGYWRIGGDNLNSWPSTPLSRFFQGEIDDVAIYSNALNDQQIQNHYALAKGAGNVSPVASFTSSTEDLVASVNGSASSDPDGTIASYSWDFGDGSPAGSGATASHTYASAGTYQVKLTVTDNKGATGSVTNAVTVTAANQSPVASFTSSTADLVASVNGSASSDPDGTIASYSWDFGDGSPAGSGATASHTYASAGTYQVKLTVTDNKGATGSVTNAVTVTAANQSPVASFTSSTADLVASVNGSASSDPDGTIATYSWDFGDGSPAGSGATASHTYASAGTYQVKLTVTDNKGATGSATKAVTVSVAPGDVLALDDFARTVQSGFGNANVGGAWSVDTWPGPVYSVSGGAGKMVTNAGQQPNATLNSVSSSSTDLTVRAGLDKRADGGGYFISVLARKVGSNNDYRAKAWISSTGQVTFYLVRRVAGAETTLTSMVVPGLTFVGGDQLQIRIQATGVSPTNLKAKIWKASDTEPTAWTSSTTDSTAVLQANGSIGLNVYLSGSATVGPVTASFSALAANRIQ